MSILKKLIKYQRSFVYPNVEYHGYKEIYINVHINDTKRLKHYSYGNWELYCSESKKQFIQIICLISAFFEDIGYKTNGPLRIIYVPEYLQGKKKVPSNHQVLGPIEVNSGFTYDNNLIIVYRREESSKVLIHELIHAYKLDADVRVTTPDNVKINSSVEIRYAETYTELLSGLIYITILNKHIDLPTKYAKLREHYIKQAEKILCVYSHDTLNQHTHVFEYIVAKAALVKEYNDLKTLTSIYESNKIFSEALSNVLKKNIFGTYCELSSLPKLK